METITGCFYHRLFQEQCPLARTRSRWLSRITAFTARRLAGTILCSMGNMDMMDRIGRFGTSALYGEPSQHTMRPRTPPATIQATEEQKRWHGEVRWQTIP